MVNSWLVTATDALNHGYRAPVGSRLFNQSRCIKGKLDYELRVINVDQKRSYTLAQHIRR